MRRKPVGVGNPYTWNPQLDGGILKLVKFQVSSGKFRVKFKEIL